MTGADFSRTCEGCADAADEGKNGALWVRCLAPGWATGYVVADGHYLPYVPAWCPHLGTERAGTAKPETPKLPRK